MNQVEELLKFTFCLSLELVIQFVCLSFEDSGQFCEFFVRLLVNLAVKFSNPLFHVLLVRIQGVLDLSQVSFLFMNLGHCVRQVLVLV